MGATGGSGHEAAAERGREDLRRLWWDVGTEKDGVESRGMEVAASRASGMAGMTGILSEDEELDSVRLDRVFGLVSGDFDCRLLAGVMMYIRHCTTLSRCQ